MKNFNNEFFLANFQLDGSHLIEASAGTGKTYNIQNIYARLIMEKGLRVSQIQVMTYTDAATKELHERLHTILQDVYARLCEQDCQEEDEEKREKRNERADKLIKCIPGTIEPGTMKRRVEMALLEFDQSAISTIHGFCQRVLSRYAFDAGINFSSELENNENEELDVLTEDWWRNNFSITTDIKLSSLKQYVKKLAGRSDYKIKTDREVKKKNKKKVKEENENNAAAKPPDLLEIAQSIVEKYNGARQDSPTMTFDDLLRLLRNALKEENPRSEKLIAKLRGEFKAALIDEFQDTDPVQYEIFERIFMNGNPNPLFFVGDPKQAIYAFRGGDIFTYLMAKENVQDQSSLTVNYRSTKKLMESVNNMFVDSTDRKTFEHEQITYPGATVNDDPKIKGPKLDKPFKIKEFDPSSNNLSLGAEWPRILELITQQIHQILTEKDGKGKLIFSPGDIAVLVNANERGHQIHQRLMKAHIPSVTWKPRNVFASTVVAKELWLFLLAVINPTKRKVLPCAVTTVFCENSPSDMQNLENPKFLAEYVKKFSSLNHEWKSHGLAALVTGLEDGGYRKRLAERPDGTRQLADISKIWELCFSAVKQIGSSPEKLVNWLAERINKAESEEKDSEKYAREMETDEAAVKILTIHTSKGLQFPVVLLPDVWNINMDLNKPYCYHDTEKCSNELSNPRVPQSSCPVNVFISNSESENIKSLGRTEQMQEKIRLLYVAMTRAIERMILFVPSGDTNQKLKNQPLYKLLNNLKVRGGENLPYEVITVDSTPGNEKYKPPEENTSIKDAKIPPEIKTTYFKKSFSSMFGKKDKDDDNRDVDSMTEKSVAVSDDAEHPIFQIPGGAAIGTCWHNILEKVPFDAEEKKIREIAEDELTNDGLMKHDGILDITTDMILKTLHYEFQSPDGDIFSLSEVPWSDRLSEQGFDVHYEKLDIATLKDILKKYWAGDPLKENFLKKLTSDIHDYTFGDGFLNGFIDLIFRHGEYFYVIDWKSNSIGGKRENFTESGVCAEMAKHLYFFQYLLYSVILHSYLKQTLGSRYSWEKNFGGIRYCFLRGIAAGGEAPVFEDRPSEKMLDKLEVAFGLTGKE